MLPAFGGCMKFRAASFTAGSDSCSDARREATVELERSSIARGGYVIHFAIPYPVGPFATNSIVHPLYSLFALPRSQTLHPKTPSNGGATHSCHAAGAWP